jgi:hypothetical protein
MNEQQPSPDAGPKRPYQRPTLKKVDLRPEEAVLGSCKQATVAGPGAGNCLDGADCFTTGS